MANWICHGTRARVRTRTQRSDSHSHGLGVVDPPKKRLKKYSHNTGGKAGLVLGRGQRPAAKPIALEPGTRFMAVCRCMGFPYHRADLSPRGKRGWWETSLPMLTNALLMGTGGARREMKVQQAGFRRRCEGVRVGGPWPVMGTRRQPAGWETAGWKFAGDLCLR